ncbi:MAG: flagellar hook capping FlgD N-terminal domain-containing protein [Chloroflexota bacterium]
MASIAATSSTTSTDTKSSAASLGAAAGMGKDDFMQLLIAQLKNQDPMKPMEDKEFITQLAQFSSLEAVEKMNSQLEELLGSQSLVQAATLIGKQATAKLTTGETLTGVISEVRMISGQPTAIINGQEVDTSLITVLGTAPAATTSTAATSAATATRTTITPTATTPAR